MVTATVNESPPTFRVPTVINATVCKPTQNTLTGIGFISRGGRIRLSSISVGGLFNCQTDLRVGDDCVAVNGVHLKNHAICAEMIRNAKGKVTITVTRGPWSPDVVMATVYKERINVMTGISLMPSPQSTGIGLVRIKRVISSGLFDSTDISVGDILLSVNGVVTSDSVHAGQLVRSTEGPLTLVVHSRKRAKEQAVEFVFHRDYNINWKSADECELSLKRAVTVKFLLFFSDVQNTATHVNIRERFLLRVNPKLIQAAHMKFARGIVELNDILFSVKNGILRIVAGEHSRPIPVKAELIDEEHLTHCGWIPDLEKLATLYREGLLTKSEFFTAKTRLLRVS